MSFANCDSVDECNKLQKEYNYQLDELQKQINNIRAKIENIIETTNSLKQKKQVEYKKQVKDLGKHLKNKKIQEFLLIENCTYPYECENLLQLLIKLDNDCNNDNDNDCNKIKERINFIEERIKTTKMIQSFLQNTNAKNSEGGKYRKTKKLKTTIRKTKKNNLKIKNVNK